MTARANRTTLPLLLILLGCVVVGGLLWGAQPASAQNNCMDNAFPGNLVCTSNDVRIAGVDSVCVGTCCTPSCSPQCILGSNVTFTATFQVLLGAQARYDIGLYFASDGDPNGDGALTGQCSVNTISNTNSANFVQLDAAPDSCGDIDATHNPQLVNLTITAACQDSDGDGTLNLPNCVSWRQPGSNETCTSPANAFPGSPSKCKCDIGFNIPILVERPNIGVDKTASPTQLNEPGGSVDFTVTVTNPAQATSVTLTTIVDDPDNNPATNNSVTYQASAICGKTVLGPNGDSTTCTFTRTVSGNAGDNITDQACVNGIDSNNNPVGPTCSTATVSIADVLPTAAVTKTVVGLVCAVVRYNVKVENTDLAESLTLSQLSDNQFGDITQVQGKIKTTNCSVPQTILSSSNFQCQFEAEVCTSPHTDTVTGTLSDNDGNTITPSGGVTVTITVQ